ncbi:MAG: hypothetical protein WCJ30_27915, partial [Deltaproteobacteria bacterium]
MRATARRADIDPTSCGSCGNVCALANAASPCIAGRCVLGACTPGFGNCDSNTTNCTALRRFTIAA